MFLRFLSRSNPLKEYYFYVPRICLQLMGFWPGSPRSRRILCWAVFNFIILLVGVVTELHAGFSYLNYDLEKGLDTLCPAGTSAVTVLKMILISYYRQDLEAVLKKMHQMLYGCNEKDMEHKAVYNRIIRQSSVMAARVNFAPFLAGFITCTAYNLKPLILVWIFWSKGKDLMWLTPFNMTMPKFLLEGPLYPLAYIFTAYTGYVTIFTFGGSDALYFEYCTHIATLLKMLQTDVKLLFRKFEGKLTLTPTEAAYVEEQLILIIKRHNVIIEMTDFFRKRYSIITLAHFVSASMVIGASIFEMLTYTGFGRFIYLGYTVAALSQLAVYCYGGTLVAENSIYLATVVFKCNWYICDPKLRRIILMIICRSQKSLNMSVPFFSPSMSTFASILQTSGSIIALASSFQ
ncbi:odorant receptor 10a [Musca domestica]|uniref:Odorant receptor n=1 Tax=Musca domestica TaxID=7370 RepID=A0A1I8NEG6_MUSDO|nr:odorant receptor 10a [Musca domestica]